MRLKNVIFSFLFLIMLVSLSFAEPGIKIVEPQDGAIVHPGEEITLRVEAVEGFLVTNGQMMSKIFFEQFTSLPATFTITIPEDASGVIPIGVMGGSTPDKNDIDQIILIVQQTATLQSLEIDQDEIFIDLDWDGNIKTEDRSCKSCFVTAYGLYSDGIKREIPKEELTYASSDPTVASVDNNGNCEFHKVGQASITISNSGVSKVIPLVFIKPTGIRPLETIPPTIQINTQPSANQAGWNNSDITITLTAKDNEGGSGMGEIYYEFPYISAEDYYTNNDRIDIPFSKEGKNLFRYGAHDKERNTTGQQSTELRLDKTPPQLSLTSPRENTQYFHDEVIPLTYTSTDALSGINSTLLSLDNTDITGQANIQPKVGSHALALTATDKADNKANLQANFIVKLKADITIKPEVFLSNKGIFLAIVKFPSGYGHKTITDAVCDGALAKKIIKTKKSAIIVFRKQDITETPIDTAFTVKGHFANNLIFEGTDTIKKVIRRQGKKDKEDEETELNKAIDESLGNDKAECKRIKKQIQEPQITQIEKNGLH